MNKKEAIALIKSELEKGTPEGEIIETLMSQDKISNRKPTEDSMKALLEEAKSTDKMPSGDEPDEPNVASETKSGTSRSTASQSTSANWEEWKVEVTLDEKGNIASMTKTKKIKDVRIDDEVANRMNAAMMTCGNGRTIDHVIQYFPKED